jgi:hypothetical protein
MAQAIRDLAERSRFQPTLVELTERVQDVAEMRARANLEVERREAWKRAAERGIDAGPRPEAVIPDEYKEWHSRNFAQVGRIGEDPDKPTMRRDEQLRRLDESAE